MGRRVAINRSSMPAQPKSLFAGRLKTEISACAGMTL
jgi:hypothetical protein